MNSKKIVTTAIGLVATSLVGCSNVASPPATVPQEPVKASDTSLNSAWQKNSFSTFYDQPITWEGCDESYGLDQQIKDLYHEEKIDPSAFECATVKAPLDWSDPSNEKTINLGISRIKATEENNEQRALFGNPGGPGVSGLQHNFSLVLGSELSKIREKYDLWGFDPRGVGASSGVQCEDSATDVESVNLAECLEKNEVAHFMGTSQVARDMEMLRALSGSSKLDYLGYSYGTVLGATYATLFPEQAGRMVLDSAENAQWASLIHSFDQQVAVAKAVGKLADTCSSRTLENGEPIACPFTSEQELLALKKQLDAKPWTATDGTAVGGLELRDFLTSALYGPDALLSTTLDTLGRAKAGDQQAIDSIAEELAAGGASVDTAGQVTMCHSTPKTPNVPELIEHMRKVGVPEFVGGPELTNEVLEEFVNLDCSVMPEAGDDITTRFDASKVETPLLVVGVTGDHATPYQHSQQLTKELGRSVLLTLNGTGHGASYAEKSQCINKAVDDYLLDGKLPEKDTVCEMDKTEEPK